MSQRQGVVSAWKRGLEKGTFFFFVSIFGRLRGQSMNLRPIQCMVPCCPISPRPLSSLYPYARLARVALHHVKQSGHI